MKNQTKKEKTKYKRKRSYLEMRNEFNISYKPESNNPKLRENKSLHKPQLKIDYNININKIYEINNLSYTEKIIKPNIDKIIMGHNNINENELSILNKSDNKIIDDKIFFIREMYADGNCFYRSLSFYLTNSQEYYNYFRNYIYNYIIDNEYIYKKDCPYVTVKGKIMDIHS